MARLVPTAVQKQHLLVEFSTLKYACPKGIYMSITPGDPTIWSGVLFVKQGPYAPSILRFQISFPPSYPVVLPVVAFLTDIFHPLVTPLTTYMYSTDVQEEGWHGQRSWRDADTINSSKNAPASNSTDPSTNDPAKAEAIPPAGHVSIFEILRYVRRSFEEECLLNTLPIEAAGNPGAWHAWRTFQAKNGKLISISPEPVDSVDAESDEVSQSMSFTVSSGRKPGDWNWDGVWEERVKKGIENSMADSVLYGLTSSGDQLINFLNMDPIEIEAIRENMSRATGAR